MRGLVAANNPPRMSCVEVTPEMRELLQVLKHYSLPDDEFARLKEEPVFAMARHWGWVMESGEHSGTGLAHAAMLDGDGPRHGILPP